MAHSDDFIKKTEAYGAHNYAPLPVVLSSGKGAWVTDVDGKKYLDMLSAYSALNFGHSNERFLKIAQEQLSKITITSRAFYNDQFGGFCEELAALCGMEMVLAMNSGAEAVESAIKAARRWGYQKKGVAPGKAEIVCMENNFAGRTICILSFSTNEEYREDFGPFTPGFTIVPFGDANALRGVITPNTVAVLLEPIQGEAGILIPPEGFLREVRQICNENKLLMIADEIQTGLCRTGKVFCCEHEQVKPDLYVLGKSLGGGIVPISAVIGSREVLGLFNPGSHGSTFGGNSFACAIAREVIRFIREEKPEELAAKMGAKFLADLRTIQSKAIAAIRGRGMMIGIDIHPEAGKAKDFCKKLKGVGLLCKDTRDQTLRMAPPLTISAEDLSWAIEQIRKVF